MWVTSIKEGTYKCFSDYSESKAASCQCYFRPVKPINLWYTEL